MKKRIGTNWTEYDDGFSVGTSGDGGGAIVRDEEHKHGARITLEEESSLAEFAVTCAVYGWMFHTRLFDVETEANEAFDEMRAELEEILETAPPDDAASEDERENFAEELALFVEKYP